jgi:hypothetical protein
MPMYRVQLQDGQERTLHAARVVTDGSALRFENPAGGRWQPVLTVPADQVQHLVRRVNETHGWRGVRAKADADATRPDTPADRPLPHHRRPEHRRATGRTSGT